MLLVNVFRPRRCAIGLVERFRSRLPVPQGLEQINPLNWEAVPPLDRDLEVLRRDYEVLPPWRSTEDFPIPADLNDQLTRGPQQCATWLLRSRPWRLRCQHGQILRLSGQVLHDPSTDWSGLYGRSWPLWPGRRQPGMVLSLTNHGTPNLYHWLFNPTLQLLRQMESLQIDPSEAVALYLGPAWPDPLPIYVEQTLHSLGLGTKPRIKRAVYPESLLMSMYASTVNCPSHAQFQWLRHRLAPARTGSGLRLYLGRGNAARRRVLNEPALMAELEGMGFICIPDPGVLDFKQQSHLLAHADVVLAPHGAALSLLFCCSPGTKVLEIHSPSYLSPLYAWMSLYGGLRYTALLAQPRSNPAMPSMDDLWVEPQIVLDRLSEWGIGS